MLFLYKEIISIRYMKNLNNFIQEKLKINSKTQINNTEEICKYIYNNLWGITDENKEMYSAIEKWVKDNDVNEVIPIVHPESLNDISEFIDDDIIKQYKSDMKSVEDCEQELEKAENIYHYSGRGENIDIMCTDNMIAILGWYGTLYCVKK